MAVSFFLDIRNNICEGQTIIRLYCSFATKSLISLNKTGFSTASFADQPQYRDVYPARRLRKLWCALLPMATVFRAAKQNRIFQDVVDQVQEAIIDGRLKAGDRLPAERELKDMLQTSRSTLREALRVLEQKGLIEIKLGPGGGAIVRAVSADQVTESLDLLIRFNKVSLAHLAQFREGLEGDVVAVAAAMIAEKDVAHLDQLLDRAAACASRGRSAFEDFLQVDKDIHLAFAQITANPLYISVLTTLHENINRYYERFLDMGKREMKENLQDLRDICAAVQQSRAQEARSLAISHVKRFNQYMRRGKPANRTELPQKAN